MTKKKLLRGDQLFWILFVFGLGSDLNLFSKSDFLSYVGRTEVEMKLK